MAWKISISLRTTLKFSGQKFPLVTVYSLHPPVSILRSLVSQRNNGLPPNWRAADHGSQSQTQLSDFRFHLFFFFFAYILNLTVDQVKLLLADREDSETSL